MKQFFALLFLLPFVGAAQEHDSLREKRNLASFGIGLISGDVSLERFWLPARH